MKLLRAPRPLLIVSDVPIALLGEPRPVEGGEVAREKSSDALDTGAPAGHGGVVHVRGDSVHVEIGRWPIERKDRLGFGGEEQMATNDLVAQRLDSQAIADQDQSFPAGIPEGDAEHPIDSRNELQAVFFVQMNDDLTVSGSLERMPLLEKIFPQRSEVVDFAIEDHPEAGVLVGHRLVTSGKIDDAEATKPQTRIRRCHEALIVGTSVPQRAHHDCDVVPIDFVIEINDPADAAHEPPGSGPERSAGPLPTASEERLQARDSSDRIRTTPAGQFVALQ